MGAVVAGAVFTAGTTAYAVTAFVVNLAVSYVIGRILAPDAPSMSGESRELKRTIRAPASPRRVIYGETLCGGNLIFAESTGSTNQYLHMVIAYAGHQVDNIGDIYINDTISTDARFGAQNATVIVIGFLYARFLYCDTPTNVTYHVEVDGVEYSNASIATLAAALPTGQYTATAGVGILTLTGNTPGSSFTVNRAWREADCDSNGVFVESTPAYKKETQSNALLFLNKHNGVPDQEADSDLVSNVPQWTAAHQLQGIAYLYIRLRYDDSAWLTGIPEVRAVVRGKQVYNPVTEQWAWTDNWALCVRDYLTSSFGLSCADTEIESTLMAAAISTSDEEVVHPGPGRYKHEWGWNAIADLAGWTNTNCNLTTDTTDPDHDNILVTPTTTNPYISKSSLSVDGYVYYKVRALIKRITGTGWEGSCYYSTSGHSFDAVYRKDIALPSGIDSGWVIAEWDMSSLTAGGTDWIDNTITGIRLDLANDAATEFRVAFVSVSKPYKRYTCNGAFALDQKPADIMDKILTAGAGSLVFSQGKYRLYAGEYHTPTVTLDESDLRGPIKIRPRQSRKELFNEVKGLYIEPNQFWESIEFPIVQNATYVTQDNDETITREIELPFTQDPYTAQRIAKIHLEKSRQGITIEYPCKLTALQTSAMDTVMVNNTAFGWSSKVFRILSWSLASDGGVDLVMQEEAAAVYDWNNGNATFADPAPDTNLPSPWTLTAPDTLALDSSATHHISNVDGSTSVRIYVTWNKTDDRQKGFDVEYKISSQSNWTRNSTFIPDEYDYVVVPIDGTNYDVRVRGVSTIGVNSDWVTETSHSVPTGNVATAIANQGDLAILNQVDWETQVAGAKPENYAASGNNLIYDPGFSHKVVDGIDYWPDITGAIYASTYGENSTPGIHLGANGTNVDVRVNAYYKAKKGDVFYCIIRYFDSAALNGAHGSFFTQYDEDKAALGDIQHFIASAGSNAWNTEQFSITITENSTAYIRPALTLRSSATTGFLGVSTIYFSTVQYNADVTQDTIETGITLAVGYLTGGTDTILLDYSNRRVTIGDETYGGPGIQLEYNSGSPRSYTGNGDTKYIEFDGTDVILGPGTEFRSVDAYNNTVAYHHLYLGSISLHKNSSGTGASNLQDLDAVQLTVTSASSGAYSYAFFGLYASYYNYSWSNDLRFKIAVQRSFATPSNVDVYFGVGYDQITVTGDFIGFYVTNGNIYGKLINSTGSAVTGVLSTEAAEGLNFAVACIWDASASTAYFYINGSLVGSLTSATYKPNGAGSASQIFGSSMSVTSGTGTASYRFGEFKYLAA